MVFGLGKKNEEQAPAPTQQMSAEAMAMLSQMTQQGGNAQAAPMANASVCSHTVDKLLTAQSLTL